MLKKINRQTAIQQFPVFPLRYYDRDLDEDIFNSVKVYQSYILTLESKSYKTHVKKMGIQLLNVLESMGCDHFIFLGDIDVPWLYRLGKYESFQESLQYLVDNKLGKRFNGALQVSKEELPTFIKHLCWLVRTNGVFPYIHFTDPGQHITCDICQYTNLHVSTNSKQGDKVFKEAVTNTDLIYTDWQSCYNKFSKSAAIKGRTMTF